MSEVYRARNTKLHRSVAIKALPDSFASDSGRLALRTRSTCTRVTQSSAHCPDYGLEAQDTRSFIVMELVEGGPNGSLDNRTTIDEAMLIARQIAEALESGARAGDHSS